MIFDNISFIVLINIRYAAFRNRFSSKNFTCHTFCSDDLLLYWSVLVSFCDGSIFQKYVGPNHFTVKLAVEEEQICDLETQIANLLDPPPEQICYCYYTTGVV